LRARTHLLLPRMAVAVRHHAAAAGSRGGT